MTSIETIGTVQQDGTLTAQVPSSVPPGRHRLVVLVETQPEVDSPSAMREAGRNALGLMTFDVELVDPTDTFRREDMYGPDGR